MLRRPQRAFVLVVTAGILALLTSCADPSTAAGGAATEGPEPGPSAIGPAIQWDAPFGSDAPTFTNTADAASGLPFKPEEPSWGKPSSIQTIPESMLSSKADQQIAFIYDLPDEGKVLVEESLPGDYSIDVFAQMVADHPASSADSTGSQPEVPPFQLVEVRGTKGLLVQANGIGRVMWIEDGLLFDIFGESVTPDQVLRLANGM